MDLDQKPPETPVSPEQKPSLKHPHPLVKLFIGLVIVVVAYMGGYQTGKKGYTFVPKDFKIVNRDSLPQTVDYSLLWNAIDILNTKYIDKPVDQQKILYGAIKGAVAAVGDPYTVFFPPQDLSNFKTQLQGSFGGIGAEVGQKDGNIVIIAPIDGTPAAKAGLQAKDIIAQVDGKSTADWSVDEAVSNIRGPKGTKVTLTIVREGKDKPFDVTMTRDTIQIKSVKWQFKDVTVNGEKKTVAVITVSEFGDDTKPLFDQAVNDVLTHHVSGIILDLRNNPGGYLQTAVSLASNWVKQGDLVVSEAHSDGTKIDYKSEGSQRLGGIPTIVMINGGSASASEILSGALHDHGIAKLLGEKSFGKGSVQEIIDLSGGSGLKVTVAKWITPNGVNLNHNGLDPDIPVKLTADDVSAGKDPQMDKALEEVTK